MTHDINDLVNTWVLAQNIDVHSDQYDEISWAIDELFVMAHDEPEQLLLIIQKILEINVSKKVLGAIGAGVMEDLLVHNGDRIINDIVLLSNANKYFNRILKFTFIESSEVSEDVFTKLENLKSIV